MHRFSKAEFRIGLIGVAACAVFWCGHVLIRGAVSKPVAATCDMPIHATIAADTDNAPLAMIYSGRTAQECRAWQQRFGKQLADLLGDIQPPAKWSVLEEQRVEMDDHVRLELVLHAENVPPVPLYLLIPGGLQHGRRRPGILCIHGHGYCGHHPTVGRTDIEGVQQYVDEQNGDYGLEFVRRGYVVVAPCMIPFGRRVDRELYDDNDPCASTFVAMQALGQLPIAANLRDLRWSIDLLQSRPEVDASRIGCAGLSYGGRMAMLVTAMDPRIRVAAVSGAMTLLQSRIREPYSCGSQIIPGLLEYGDYPEIASLMAPRPCVWEVGRNDPAMKPEGARVFRDRLFRAYESLDSAHRLYFDDFEGGHRWNGAISFPLFDDVLEHQPTDSGG